MLTFGLDPLPVVQMWVPMLNMWVFVVHQKTGQAPVGTLEVTPADAERLSQLVTDGWPLETAVYRALGVSV